MDVLNNAVANKLVEALGNMVDAGADFTAHTVKIMPVPMTIKVFIMILCILETYQNSRGAFQKIGPL